MFARVEMFAMVQQEKINTLLKCLNTAKFQQILQQSSTEEREKPPYPLNVPSKSSEISGNAIKSLMKAHESLGKPANP